MTVKSYSYVRENFKDMINKVNDDSDAIIITTKDRNAVMMSEESYNEIMETLYLQQSPSNAKRLSESIENLERGNVRNKDISI
ncbi:MULTISPECIES: type II toxin-antitoxin system Phd/YefM family antitoxin [Jeotgalicoccus]|uniref:type II toxin-antitoxin system Phd/YefM family antitoxin n=1 Tax=Jeotgalicoccus TaxID=227979 RepID=UPI0004250311|nr:MULTISPECIES: type II toxin-antitoxin system prevent-host-death family antitoxin [Jeotgalicoccus]QQD84956.1 type II toxin-antitoxin system Phd/YefM family antitoxin [Jeotgalicoccus sp. ATCC 8456]